MVQKRSGFSQPQTLRAPLLALELFCGIGGFAEAAKSLNWQVVAALDQSLPSLSTYRLNHPLHPALQANLESISAQELLEYEADFWWLSPPCQPYSIRGKRKDLDDPRASSLKNLLTIIKESPTNQLPHHMALENVEGFLGSQAHIALNDTLSQQGYHLEIKLLCPTDIGIPMRRKRCYLLASKEPFLSESSQSVPSRPLKDYLLGADSKHILEELNLPPELLKRFRPGLRILDSSDPHAYTTCFGSSYGKAHMHSGSYLQQEEGVRYFSPLEIIYLLGFEHTFTFPKNLNVRKQWQQAGNSLSVDIVKKVLKCFRSEPVQARD